MKGIARVVIQGELCEFSGVNAERPHALIEAIEKDKNIAQVMGAFLKSGWELHTYQAIGAKPLVEFLVFIKKD